MSAHTPRVTQWIASVLRWGCYLSASLLLVGFGWVLVAPDVPIQAGPPIPLPMLVYQLREGNPYAVMQLGVLLLLMTPVVRVIAAAFSFALAGERRYALVSLAVLGLILISLLGAG